MGFYYNTCDPRVPADRGGSDQSKHGRADECEERSAKRRDAKLLANLTCQTIVDFGVTRHWSFRAIGRVGVDCVATSSCRFNLAASQCELRTERVRSGRHRQPRSGSVLATA